MNGYLIRTRSGTKGPFSIEQLRAFVESGKVPRTFRVTEAATGKLVAVEQLLGSNDDDAFSELLDSFAPPTEGAAESAEAIAQEEPFAEEEPEPAPPPRTRPRPGMRPGARPGAGRGRPGAGTGRRPLRGPRSSGKRNNLVLYVAVGAGAVALLAVGYFFVLPLITGGGGIEGVWVLDVDAFAAEAAKNAPPAANDAASAMLIAATQAAFKEAMKNLELEVGPTTATIRGTMMGKTIPPEEATAKLRPLGDGTYELITTKKDGTQDVEKLALRDGRLWIDAAKGKLPFKRK